ncbi:MAG: type II toxin-antitoxin system VapC family toxin [Chromatiales bacterium]|jgi:predicted nucleic acid-binding protein
MIVVDTNVISYLLLPTPHTAAAERLLQTEPSWAAPLLWRSEFRNVLALYLRKHLLRLDQALRLQERAEALLAGKEYQVTSATVLALAERSGCSAYDCEFVALAQDLGTSLVTADQAVLQAFPERTRPLSGSI